MKESSGARGDETGEPAFQFVADLSSYPAPGRPGVHRKLAAGEVDFSEGWMLLQPSERHANLSDLISEFQAYLRLAFGCEVKSAVMTQGQSKLLEVSIDSSIPGSQAASS